jgi:hypothetical protein
MDDLYEHPNLEPTNPRDVLAWLHDGFGGLLSEDARERIRLAIAVLDAGQPATGRDPT